MLATALGEDIAPYHKRQVIPLTLDQWADWLDPDIPAANVLRVLPKGSLPATRVFPPEPAQAARARLMVSAPLPPPRPRAAVALMCWLASL